MPATKSVTRIEIPDSSFFDGLPTVSGVFNFALGILFLFACLLTYGINWCMIGVAFLFFSGDLRPSP